MDEKLSPPEMGSPTQAYTSGAYVKPQQRKPHDNAVLFEEYYYYAQRTREEEKTLESPSLNWREFLSRKKNNADALHHDGNHEAQMEVNANAAGKIEITDEEWTNASRAFRTASWGACTVPKDSIGIRVSADSHQASISSPPTFSALMASASRWAPSAGVRVSRSSRSSVSWPATLAI